MRAGYDAQWWWRSTAAVFGFATVVLAIDQNWAALIPLVFAALFAGVAIKKWRG